MNIEQYREYCITKKGVTEHFPFDNNVLVFKVMNKVFALSGVDSWEKGEPKINLKCNPDKAITLREKYQSVNSGYHMSKKHWNTITLNQEVSDNLVFEFINHSYDLVVQGLTKKLRAELENM